MKGDGGGSSEAVLNALETMIENLRKECYAKFANREALDGLQINIKDL